MVQLLQGVKPQSCAWNLNKHPKVSKGVGNKMDSKLQPTYIGTTTTWNKETWHLWKLDKMKLIINFLITLIIQIQNMAIVYGMVKGSKNMNVKRIHASHGTSIHEWHVQTQITCDDNVNSKSKKKMHLEIPHHVKDLIPFMLPFATIIHSIYISNKLCL